MRISFLAVVVAVLLQLFTCAASASPISKDRKPILDLQGVQKYAVTLNENLVSAADDHGEPPARDPRHPLNAHDIYGWQKPKVRALVKLLEKTYGIKATEIVSYTVPGFGAFIPVQVVDAMRLDPRIKDILPLTEGAFEFAWANLPAGGGEIIPWGKSAIGTNDFYTASTLVYMIDGPAMIDGTVSIHADLNILGHAPVNSLPDDSGWFNVGGNRGAAGHANHVAGILGARMNTGRVRGINPGAPIYNVEIGTDPSQFAAAMNWVKADAENRGIYAVANISTIWTDPTTLGMLDDNMRSLSSRVLVVQAAGNHSSDACAVTYAHPDPNDGILVVGAIDEAGAAVSTFDNSAAPGWGVGETGTNGGPCVEVWAPGQRIWSTWNTSTTAIQVLSGTSMAAPHVAALAARAGDTTMTPVAREQYIRSRLFATGFYDRGRVIKVPSFTQSPDTRPESTLTNMSTRGLVLTGDNVLIAGFIISGTTSKTVAVRAFGQTLGDFGIANYLGDPYLQIVNSSGTVVAQNDNWQTDTNAGQLASIGYAPRYPSESAILRSLPPGSYTAIVSGAQSTTGVGLFSVDEIDHADDTFVNMSARGYVSTGDNILIGGFAISGAKPMTVVLRARGPALSAFGVSGAMTNPTIQLFSGSQLIASNDDWQNGPTAGWVLQTGFQPSDARESAMLVTLNPGLYTFHVSGYAGETGVASAEIFAVP